MEWNIILHNLAWLNNASGLDFECFPIRSVIRKKNASVGGREKTYSWITNSSDYYIDEISCSISRHGMEWTFCIQTCLFVKGPISLSTCVFTAGWKLSEKKSLMQTWTVYTVDENKKLSRKIPIVNTNVAIRLWNLRFGIIGLIYMHKVQKSHLYLFNLT